MHENSPTGIPDSTTSLKAQIRIHMNKVDKEIQVVTNSLTQDVNKNMTSLEVKNKNISKDRTEIKINVVSRNFIF